MTILPRRADVNRDGKSKCSDAIEPFILAVLLIVVCTAGIVVLVRHLVGSQGFGIPLPSSAGFEAGVLGADETADQIAFALWLACPLLILPVARVLIWAQHTRLFSRFLFLAVVPVVVTTTLALVGYTLINADIVILTPPQQIALWVVLMFLGLVALAWVSSNSMIVLPVALDRFKNLARQQTRYMTALLALWCVAGLMFRMIIRGGSVYDTYHAPFAWADLLAPATGVFPMATYIAQYAQFAGYAVEPYVLLSEGKPFGMSLLMAFVGSLVGALGMSSHFGPTVRILDSSEKRNSGLRIIRL